MALLRALRIHRHGASCAYVAQLAVMGAGWGAGTASGGARVIWLQPFVPLVYVGRLEETRFTIASKRRIRNDSRLTQVSCN